MKNNTISIDTSSLQKLNSVKYGGESITGSINKSTADDLRFILRTLRKKMPSTSKINSVRWAIKFTADALRNQELN